MKFRKGFTLIELLIVVAIIAILAAIAVPNFLEAQVRAKVSRCKNDMRSLATALESYKIDSNHYVPDGLFYTGGQIGGGIAQWLPLYRLSTPVAYITSIPGDLFVNTRGLSGSGVFKNSQLGYSGEETFVSRMGQDFIGYAGVVKGTGQINGWVSLFGGGDVGKRWSLASVGPDRFDSWGTWIMFGNETYLNKLPPLFALRWGCVYDPTNGSISDGDIVRSGP